MEGSHSGLVQRFTKPPCRKIPWVQIPLPPPKFGIRNEEKIIFKIAQQHLIIGTIALINLFKKFRNLIYNKYGN